MVAPFLKILKRNEIDFSLRTKSLGGSIVEQPGSSLETSIQFFFISMLVLAGEKITYGRLQLNMELSIKVNIL